MKNFLPFILLLCSALMGAQTQRDHETATHAENTGNETTMQGCLNGSAGNYTLTDSSGQQFQVAGDTDKLQKHVGHKVEVAGTTSGVSSTSDPSATNPSSSDKTDPTSSGTTGAKQPTLNVTSVKDIAGSCDSGR